MVPLVRTFLAFPLLGSAFNNLSPRLHIGFMHITVAQIFGFGGRTGTHTNTGGQRGSATGRFQIIKLCVLLR